MDSPSPARCAFIPRTQGNWFRQAASAAPLNG
jgi:hypothetical protein